MIPSTKPYLFRATVSQISIYDVQSQKNYVFTSDTNAYPMILDALKPPGPNYELVQSILSMYEESLKEVESVTTLRDVINSSGKLQVNSNDEIIYNDVVMHGSIAKRVLETVNLGLDVSPLLRFYDRLMLNPSENSRNELFDFLEACDHPIMDDGRFLAYKSVKSTRLDAHSNSILNADGAVISMPRSQVDADSNRTCSSGLHVCSRAYGRFSEIVLEVAVDPAHVVSVPREYAMAKMRVCEYQVLRQVEDFSSWEGKPIYQQTYDEDDDGSMMSHEESDWVYDDTQEAEDDWWPTDDDDDDQEGDPRSIWW